MTSLLSVLDKKSLTFYRETDEWERYLEDDRKQTFISCWIKYPTEQSLMWYAYGKDGVVYGHLQELSDVQWMAIRRINST